MNFNYSETQRMLVDTVDRLMKSRGSVEQWRARRTWPNGLDNEAWSQFAELGWLALPVQEESGGLGGALEDVALLMIELGRGLAIEPYVSTAVLSAYVIENARRSDFRQDILEKIAGGDNRLALAHTEAGDCYEIRAARKTVATSNARGYVLNGVKTLAFDAPSAHAFIVSARLNDDEGVALFIVDRESAGLSLNAYPLIDGSQAADLHFSDVVAPAHALLAMGDTGADLLEAAVDRATIALLAQAIGSMEACVEICSAYLKERRQFGQPIGNFQALQHLAVDMLVATHQSRSMLYHALASASGAPTERASAVSAAKMVIGDAMQTVSRIGIQLHGGYGLTDEYEISHHYRRLMCLEKQYGDIEYHTERFSRLTMP